MHFYRLPKKQGHGRILFQRHGQKLQKPQNARLTAAQLADQEPTQDADADELSGSGKLEPEPQPAGLEFRFDDESRTVTYGRAVLTFRGEVQYRLLQLVQTAGKLNIRDIWRDIWGDSLAEWRAVHDNARHVNRKLEAAGIPYRISVDTGYATFSEKK